MSLMLVRARTPQSLKGSDHRTAAISPQGHTLAADGLSLSPGLIRRLLEKRLAHGNAPCWKPLRYPRARGWMYTSLLAAPTPREHHRGLW